MKMPWNRVESPSPPPAEDVTRLLVMPLEARVRALEERMAQVSGDAGLLRIEWSEVLDKISHWASRQSGRERKVAKERLDALATSQDDPGAPNGLPGVLSPHPNDKAGLRALLRSSQGRR